MTRTIVGFSIKVLAFVLIPLNVLAVDVYSGDNTFTGWEGKGKSNPFKNMSTSAAKRNAPIVSEADLIKKGEDYLFQAEYYDAIKTFNKVLGINKKNAEAHKGIGMAYFKLGNTEQYTNLETVSKAVSSFNQSIKIKQDAEVYYVLGLSYLLLNNKSSSIETYEKLKSLDQDKAKLLASQIDTFKGESVYNIYLTKKTYSEQTREPQYSESTTPTMYTVSGPGYNPAAEYVKQMMLDSQMSGMRKDQREMESRLESQQRDMQQRQRWDMESQKRDMEMKMQRQRWDMEQKQQLRDWSRY